MLYRVTSKTGVKLFVIATPMKRVKEKEDIENQLILLITSAGLHRTLLFCKGMCQMGSTYTTKRIASKWNKPGGLV